MPAREHPVVSEEDMQRVLSTKGLHPSWVASLMDAYSRGLIRYHEGGIVVYYKGLGSPSATLWLAASGSAVTPFDEPRGSLYWVPDIAV